MPMKWLSIPLQFCERGALEFGCHRCEANHPFCAEVPDLVRIPNRGKRLLNLRHQLDHLEDFSDRSWRASDVLGECKPVRDHTGFDGICFLEPPTESVWAMS